MSRLPLMILAMLALPSAHAVELRPTYPAVNEATGAQDYIGCAAAANGDIATVWRSATTARIPYVKRVDASGAVIGATESMQLPQDTISVSAAKNGAFAVLHAKANGSNTDLYLSVYNRNGQLVAAPVRVNDTQHTGITGLVKVAQDGTIAVAWYTWGNLPARNGYLKRFNANGAPLNYQRQFGGDNVYVANGVDTDTNGDVIVAFTSNTGGRYDTMAVRYSSAEDWVYPAARVNTYLGTRQWGSSLAMNAAGNYLVSWVTHGQDGNGFSTYAQLFARGGARIGQPTRVSTQISDDSASAALLFDNNSYAVAWMSYVAGQRTINFAQVDSAGAVVAAPTVATPHINYVGPFSLCGTTAGKFSIQWRPAAVSGSSWTADVLARDYMADTVVTPTLLASGVPASNLSDAAGGWKYFKVIVPANTGSMRIALSSRVTPASGNADLFLRYGGLPTLATTDGRTTEAGNNDSLTVSAPPPGTFYIGVYGQAAYAAADLTVILR